MTRPPVRGDDDWADGDAADPDAEWEDDGYGYYVDDDPAPDDAAVPPTAPPAYEYVAEYEELPPEGRRGRRVLIVLGVLAVFALIVIGGAGYYIRGQLDPPGPEGAEVRFTVPTGSSNNEVATDLEDQGIIRDAQTFRMYLKFKGADGFEAGDYILHENMAAWDVLSVLEGRPVPIDVVNFTVPPGLSKFEIPAAIIDDIPSFSADKLRDLIVSTAVRPQTMDPAITDLEGYLFPDTYQVEPADGELAALQKMAAQFDVVAGQIDLANRAAAAGLTVNEVVTIASLIQEEYGVEEEMPKISRVIYNRLAQGEPLGIDATSRYEAVLAGRDRNDVDFDSDSPYNTRRNQGLPPTPIAAPGKAALEAALAPADGPWIYYVRDPDTTRTPAGGHFFTDSPSEFQQVKQECAEAGLGCG